MTARHSPGPWSNEGAGFITAPPRNLIAFVSGRDCGFREANANAALIAAAPALLAAAKNALAHLTGGMDGAPLEEDPVALLQAAIAEAEPA